MVRLDGEGANWLYKPISFVPGVKVESYRSETGPKHKTICTVGRVDDDASR